MSPNQLHRDTGTGFSHLEKLTESSPVSVIMTDAGQKITYVNSATEKLYGYVKDELLGKSPDIFNTDPNKDYIQKSITEAVMKNFGAPADAVIVQIVEAPKTDKSKGGVPFSER